MLHRKNGLPAFLFICGAEKYYGNGKLHRTNNLPAITETYSSKGRLYKYESFWEDNVCLGRRRTPLGPIMLQKDGMFQ